MGEDGHTASLFPGTTILEVTDRIAAEVDVPQLGSRRVSVTMPHLRGARRKIVLVTGSGKRETIRRISEGEPLPMTEIVGGGGEAWWFVDREAYPG
jgi:6-phosphogluconolactonase